MSTNIRHSLRPVEDVFRDTSGSPREGGEAVSVNIRVTTIKHTRPHRHTKMNETDLRSYLPVHIYLALELPLASYLPLYLIGS